MTFFRNAEAARGFGALLMLAAASAFSTLSAAQSPSELQKVVSPGYAELLKRATAPGGTEVLVTLDLDSRAEAVLSAPEIQTQRDTIRNAQVQLGEKLRDVDARVLTTYTLFPILHMNVDQAAQDRVVSLAGLAFVNAQLAQPVTAANYLKDVNVSGTLSLADKAITNVNLTKALPTP